MLTCLKVRSESSNEGLTPKCASSLLNILDCLLQSTRTFPSKTAEGDQVVKVSNHLADRVLPAPTVLPLDLENESCNGFGKILGKSTGYLTHEECCKVLDIACDMIKQHVPAVVMHPLLQLCARLTKMHSLAMRFLDDGGVAALFALPVDCIFLGYDSFASLIIRHVLEDPQTLQTAMESENRQAQNCSGPVTPREFLTSMAPVISRDPTVFMRAVAATCQLESTEGRTLVVSKEKEKDLKIYEELHVNLAKVVNHLLDIIINDSAVLAKVAFVHKLLADILVRHEQAADTILKHDPDVCHHILHRLLPLSLDKSAGFDERKDELSEKVHCFLTVLCGRSSEGRRRVFREIVNVLASLTNFESKILLPNRKVQGFVELFRIILSKTSYSSNIVKCMIESGIVKCLSGILQVIDLDHPDAPRTTKFILKVIESLTRTYDASAQMITNDEINKNILDLNREDEDDVDDDEEEDVAEDGAGTMSLADSDIEDHDDPLLHYYLPSSLFRDPFSGRVAPPLADYSTGLNPLHWSGGRDHAAVIARMLEQEFLDQMCSITPVTNQSETHAENVAVQANDKSEHSEHAVSNLSSRQNTAIDPMFLESLPYSLREDLQVLASERAEIVEAPAYVPQSADYIDPEYLAALPPDIRAEVLAPPSLLIAEAQMLQDQATSHYRARGLYRNDNSQSYENHIVGSSPRRGASSHAAILDIKDVDGHPFLDENALRGLIRLFRVAQLQGKSVLQRLLFNLCTHTLTRITLVRLLLDMIKPEAEGPPTAVVQMNSQRLYGCQTNVVYGWSPSLNGLSPLVLRRILETLSYLVANHSTVASLLFYFDGSLVSEHECFKYSDSDKLKDKNKLLENHSPTPVMTEKGDIPLILFLKLLSQPLFLRSKILLEQLMGLILLVASKASPKDDQKNSFTSSAQQCSSLQLNSRSIFVKVPHSDMRNICSLLSCDGLSDKVYILASEVIKKFASVALPLREIFTSALSYVAQELSDSAIRELVTFKESHMIGLGASSMTGAAILRVLQALNSIVTPNVDELCGTESYAKLLSIIWKLHVSLDPLWQELSSCIAIAETQLGEALQGTSDALSPALPIGSQKLLPFTEAFFVLFQKLHTNSTAVLQDEGDLNKMEAKGHIFAEKHRRLLNAYIRRNPRMLETSLSVLLKAPRLIDFDNKQSYFQYKFHQQRKHRMSGLLCISVRREYILEDSYNQLRARSPQDLKGQLKVQFQGEEGIDAGGLTREWYQLLSRVIFDKGALLFTTVGNNATFQPNPNSVYHTDHLSYFKFVGRLVAKALFDGQLLDVYFTRSFYKHILGAKVTYHDIEAIDPEYYKSLKWILDNDVTDVPDLMFSMDADEEKHILYEKTEVTDHELKPGGRNIRVTEETKHEYVDLVADHLLANAIRPQINAFLEGFNELVPSELVSIFNDKELELLISGLPEIDLNDLKVNTEYHGYTVESSVIQWFWEAVEAFSKEDMARLLQFVAGTSRVPLEGFKAQRFQIHREYGEPERLPSAHTCSRQLNLPEYTRKEKLQERLLFAIQEASEGFGFV